MYWRLNIFHSLACWYSSTLLTRNIMWHHRSFFIRLEKEVKILLHQYHGCLWPGYARNSSTSSHGIDLILMQYSGLSTRQVRALMFYTQRVCQSITIWWHFCMTLWSHQKRLSNIWTPSEYFRQSFIKPSLKFVFLYCPSYPYRSMLLSV